MSVKTSKEKILLEAMKLFAKYGYFAVSMSEIADNAKMTKSNLYHHFNSKEDLYMQLIKKTFDDFFKLMSSYDSRLKKESFSKVFRELIEEYINFGINNKDLIYMLIQNISRLDQKVRKYIYDARMEIMALFKNYLLIGIKRGEIKKNLNAKISAEILHGLLHVIIIQMIRKDHYNKSYLVQNVDEIYKWLE